MVEPMLGASSYRVEYGSTMPLKQPSVRSAPLQRQLYGLLTEVLRGFVS
jgi:hypothetical protein